MSISKPVCSDNTNQILVKFKDEKFISDIKNHIKSTLSLKQLELKKRYKYSGAELLQLHEEDDLQMAVTHMHNHMGVHYAQPDYKLTACNIPDIESIKAQWGLENTGQSNKTGNPGCFDIDIDILDAWNITQGSESVTVAVIDTGIDIEHSGLKDSIYRNPLEIQGNGIDDDGNSYCDDISGWDFVNKDNTVFDSISDSKHGTKVAGVIAARGINGGAIGVAPKVKILPLKIMDAKYSITSCAIDAIDYAKAIGIRIVNCSWGETNYNPALKFHMQNSDMLFICAAGNKGADVSVAPFYPACFDLPNVISVAAVNNRGELWPGSNYGSNIHVAAPGACIWSTIPSKDQRGYGIDTGTSLAAPHVTGIAALLLSKFPELDAASIKDRIIKSVKPMDSLKGKIKSGGIVNAYRALII